MKKRIPNKMITEPKAETKEQKASGLVCAHECVIPGVGQFMAGDKVLQQEQIALLTGHPNFEPESKEV